MEDKGFKTKSVREGHQSSSEQEHSAAIFLTSSYRFDSAEQAAERFETNQGNVYSRFTNPTVSAFQDKLGGASEKVGVQQIAHILRRRKLQVA